MESDAFMYKQIHVDCFTNMQNLKNQVDVWVNLLNCKIGLHYNSAPIFFFFFNFFYIK